MEAFLASEAADDTTQICVPRFSATASNMPRPGGQTPQIHMRFPMIPFEYSPKEVFWEIFFRIG